MEQCQFSEAVLQEKGLLFPVTGAGKQREATQSIIASWGEFTPYAHLEQRA